VFDVETSGLSPREDVVIQLGWALVEARAVVDRGAVVIDWTRVGDPAWVQRFEERVAQTRYNIERRTGGGFGMGDSWNFNLDRIRAEGCHPQTAFEQFLGLADDCRAGGFKFVGHFGLRCDQPMIDRCCREVLGPDRGFLLAPDEYLDTMALEKGVQLGLPVQPGETWAAFIRRAYSAGGNKVRSSLSDFCVTKYNLDQRHNLDMSQAHEADFDAVLTHHLLEHFRGVMEG